MPKFIVKKFGEFVSTIVVEAEDQDDAYGEAKIALPESWSEWEATSDEGYIEHDFIEEMEEEK